MMQDILNNMMQMVMTIDTGDYPQSIKDESKRELDKAFDMIVEELGETKINQLVYEQLKKNKIKSLK